MTVDKFLEKFSLIANAPDAIDNMRQIVLGMALLGQFSTDHHSTPLSEWKPSRLDAIAAIAMGNSPPGDSYNEVGRGSPLINGPVEFSPGPFGLTVRTKFTTAPTKFCKRGDLLICVRGSTTGRTNIAAFDACIGRGVAAISAGEHQSFVNLFLWHSRYRIFALGTGSTFPSISYDDLASLELALPPVAEQDRIVAKVDELMALCDRLEAQQKERESKHAVLARAALARFAESPTPANLGYLFHNAYTINPADLRKSILTMAVRGKLVNQNGTDEPVTELLLNAADKLPPEKKRRVAKSLGDVENVPFDLPPSWKWAHFQDVAFIASNLVDPSGFGDAIHLAPDNIEKGTGLLLPCRTVSDDKVKSSNHRFYSGQLVYSKIRPNLSKVVLVDFDGLCSADMYPIDSLIEPRYLLRYMLSQPFLQQAVKTDTRVAMPKINQEELNKIAVPVPPLAEQRQIVAKVDALMSLVDRLESQLAEARTTAGKLMEAVVAELTSATGTPVVAATVPPIELKPAATSRIEVAGRFACYVVQSLRDDPELGRTKLEKCNHLAEYHCGVPLDRHPIRYRYGPVDYTLLKEAENWAAQHGGFTTHDPGKNERVTYSASEALSLRANEAISFLGKQKAEVDRLLSLLAPLDTKKCELIATVYAAWNDLLIEGKTPNDKDIIHEIRRNWHKTKETIPNPRWFWALRWLTRNQVVPMGRGRAVEHTSKE